MKERGIVWFRNDLRLEDHEALSEARAQCRSVLPVYVFDIRLFSTKTRYEFEKTGVHRTQFLIESVRNLKDSLKEKGSDLLVRVGVPEDEIFKIAHEYKSSYVYCNRERTQEEVDVQDSLEEKLWSIGQELRYSRGKMLYYTSDLPFPVTHTPDHLQNFKKEVERYIKIRKPIPTPEIIYTELNSLESGEIPDLQLLGFEESPGGGLFIGGEKEAWKRIEFIASCEKAITEKSLDTSDVSISPWVAMGCISPKSVYDHLIPKEERQCKTKDVYFSRLLKRDHHRLMGKKYGNQIFQLRGVANVEKEVEYDKQLLEGWTLGKTEDDLINAIMAQLNRTGYVSHIARKIAATYWICNLKQPWLVGAHYFESRLIDYDPCSNYGNWMYLAGLSADRKEIKPLVMSTVKDRFDPNGTFVSKWLEKSC